MRGAERQIDVTREPHGPFERIVLSMVGSPVPIPVSVYRCGDTLIDTAGSHYGRALVEALRGNPPKRIICTHQHEDHIGGVTHLRRAFGHLPVHAPEQHVELIKESEPLPTYRLEHWGQPEPILDALAYAEGTCFDAGGVALEAHSTPGHTPGHMALVAQEHERCFALTGDLHTGARPQAVWWESAADDTISSCRHLAQLGPALCMLPTHGKVRQDGSRSLSALADFIDEKANQIAATAQELRTDDARLVARAIFGAEDLLERYSSGEFSAAYFVRSVLDPVRSLPAKRLPRSSP